MDRSMLAAIFARAVPAVTLSPLWTKTSCMVPLIGAVGCNASMAWSYASRACSTDSSARLTEVCASPLSSSYSSAPISTRSSSSKGAVRMAPDTRVFTW